MTFSVLCSDALDALRDMEPDSFDALVTDPPAGIAFMGKDWDKDKGGRKHWISWLSEIMCESYRVMKPGAHGLVWALPRTSHWTATALEDAGFEIRDCIVHLFGSGFPKNKAALKPASEHWWLIRKPLSESNLAANVVKWGTGLLNIAECRIGDEAIKTQAKGASSSFAEGANGFKGCEESWHTGRWPANVVLSHSLFCAEQCAPDCAVKMLDTQSGELTSGKPTGIRKATIGYNGGGHETPITGYGDTGGASRFFFVAKPSPAEKQEALRTLSLFDSTTEKPRKNEHPTVKPVALMEHLVRLVTPDGGHVLDMFGGSGTTGIASVRLGFDVTIIEREPDYAAIARARIERATIERAA